MVEWAPCACAHVYGGSHGFPRDDILQTPPGPEGSNGSGRFVRRGVADGSHRLIPQAGHKTNKLTYTLGLG